MVSPVIIKFKRYPELGRLRVVADENLPYKAIGCHYCELATVDCNNLQPSSISECFQKDYHYEKVK